MAQNHLGLGASKVGGNVSADKTSAVPVDETSVVSADKTTVVSLCQLTSPKTSPSTFPTQGRPLRGRPRVGKVGGMSWEMSADTMTQQMSRLLTQQMSCLQTQQMSCLQTHGSEAGLSLIHI